MLEDWGKIKINEGELFKTVAKKCEKEILRLNKQQLSVGIDAEGRKLPPYSSAYARRKGKPIVPKTLFDKGTFYKDFYALSFENKIEVGSKNSKAGFLEYSERILGASKGKTFGLTDKNLDEFIPKIFYPIFFEELMKRIHDNI
jgi:hypothetical protein